MVSHGDKAMRIVWFLVVFLAVPLPQRAASDASGTVSEPHDFVRLNRSCKQCHVRVGVTKREPLRKTVGQICAECHRMNNAQHPVEIKPTLEVPADLPLDEKGLLTCATCHDIHRSRFDPATGAKTMYLRRSGAPQTFCESCHRNGI